MSDNVSGWDAAVLGDWCMRQHGVWSGLGDGDEGEKSDEELAMEKNIFLVH